MNNNISVETIKKSFESIKNYFDPEKNTYQIITNCISSNSGAEEMLDQLGHLGSTNDYPKELQDFFYEKYNDLKTLVELDKKISNSLENLKQLDKDLEVEFKKKNSRRSI